MSTDHNLFLDSRVTSLSVVSYFFHSLEGLPFTFPKSNLHFRIFNLHFLIEFIFFVLRIFNLHFQIQFTFPNLNLYCKCIADEKNEILVYYHNGIVKYYKFLPAAGDFFLKYGVCKLKFYIARTKLRTP